MPTKPHAPLQTVAYVDLKRYAGRWYEFARYANSFEKKCASDAQAEYTIVSGTKVQVRNVCRTKGGKWKESKGWGKVIDPATNAKLRVTFFWPFFRGLLGDWIRSAIPLGAGRRAQAAISMGSDERARDRQ